MPEYLTPGVYIEEIERGPRPIEGVPTSTAAFLGETERGPTTPRCVTSYKDYQRGSAACFGDDRYMPHAVDGLLRERRQAPLRLPRRRRRRRRPRRCGVRRLHRARRRAGAVGHARVWCASETSSTRDGDDNPVGFRLQLAYWSERPRRAPSIRSIRERTASCRGPNIEDYDDLGVDPISSDYYEKRLLDRRRGRPTRCSRSSNVPPGATRCRNSIDAPGRFSERHRRSGPTRIRPTTSGCRSPTARCRVSRPWSSTRSRRGDRVRARVPPADAVAIQTPSSSHCERLRFRFAVVDPDRSAPMRDLDPRTTPPPGWDTQLRGHLCAMDRDRPIRRPARVTGAAGRPRARRLRPHRCRARRLQGAGKRDRPRRARRRLDIDDDTQAVAESTRRERDPQVPRTRHPRLGRTHDVIERAVEVRLGPPALHLPRAIDLRGHPVGGVRAQ